jgi:predicted ABC-type ATPase
MPACYAVRVTFLLVSGASGAGKSSVRALVAPRLAPWVRCIELRDLVEIPAWAEAALSR